MDYVHGSYELTDERWFLVQTNYDRDEPEPLIDTRRVPAEKKMIERGNSNFHSEDLMKILMEWPNFNIATIMTVSMTAQSFYHNTTVWYGYNPKTQS